MWLDDTPLEETFSKNGLINQAKKIAKERKQHCETFIKRFSQISGS
jgi:hypothetical protein